MRARRRPVPPGVPAEPVVIERLKDARFAAAYVEAVIGDGDQAELLLALRRVTQAHGGVAAIARKCKLSREAMYRMLSENGNPELRSLSRILAAAGLRLSVRPIAGSSRQS